jgi:hypothetical protein
MAAADTTYSSRGFRFRGPGPEFAEYSQAEIERLERTQEAVDLEIYRRARDLVLRKLGYAEQEGGA